MADVTINLIDKDGVLYYKTAEMSEYEIVKEDSSVMADSGQTVAWTCGDDSIDKIQKIDVDKKKSDGKNWKDFWDQKPKATDSSKKTFEGVIKSETVDPSNPEYNGYDITYKTADGKQSTVDPDVTIPPR